MRNVKQAIKQKKYLNLIAPVIVVTVISFLGVHVLRNILAVPANYSVPTTIADNCSVDNTTALQDWLASLPAHSVVNFPTKGCYLVQGILTLRGTSGLTINGNDSKFKRTDPTVIAKRGPVLPLLFLVHNKDLAINNLGIDGGYNGTDYGGVAFEGHYGLLLESNHGVTLNGLIVNNMGGDFIDLQPNSEAAANGDHSLNTGVLVTNSKFNNAGYHGITIEAANGATFSQDTFSNIKVDAMDFEYDIYSTAFINGQPSGAAEDNISIVNNTWSNFGFLWFASYQGQVPGVQEQNITLSGNILKTAVAMLGIQGTKQNATTSQYWNTGLTVTNNTVLAPSRPVHGGAITVPFVGSVMEIANVSNVNISNNTIPAFDGTSSYFPNHPYLAMVGGSGINGTINNNKFSGALGIINPNAPHTNIIVECGNSYGVNGSKNNSPPAGPTNLTATANSSTSVNLGWTASTDTGPSLSGYYILRNGVNIADTSSTTTNYTDTTASPSTSYSYTSESFCSASPPIVSAPSAAATVLSLIHISEPTRQAEI